MNMANETKIQLRQISAYASEATIGQHRVLIDRLIAKGGTDTGPMGGELLPHIGGRLLSASTLLAAINTREKEISNVRVEVVGSLADSPTRFVGVELRVVAEWRRPGGSSSGWSGSPPAVAP